MANGVFTCTRCEHQKPWYWKAITQPKPKRSDAIIQYNRDLEEHLKEVLRK